MSIDRKISLRATNLELHSRDIFVKSTDGKIYARDTDNLYPVRMEKIINNSPTGKRCSNMMAKFIIGKGVDASAIQDKGQAEKLNDIAELAAAEIAIQYGVFFHVQWGYDIQGENPVLVKKGVRVLDSFNIVKSKEDDDGWSGKFYQLENKTGKDEFQNVTKKTRWFYPYNDDVRVVLAQMKNDCKLKDVTDPTPEQLIQNFRGQVYYLNLTPKYQYALPPWDSVYDDMDTEYRISRYNNTQSRRGWLGKTVVLKYGGDKDEDAEFDNTLKKNIGSENAADVLVVNIPEGATEDVKKAFQVEQLKAQFDDKLFESTKKTLRQNIAGNFNNVPEPLLFAGTGALFGTSAESYVEMKKFYWEQNEYERFKLERALTLLTGYQINFLPIVNELNLDKDEELRKTSQAQLKGSVGGVTALLQIQESVSEGTTDVNAAVEIIKEIFGISEETARKMLGTPETIETNELQ